MDNMQPAHIRAPKSFVCDWHFQKVFLFFFFIPPLLRDVNGSRTSQFSRLLSLPGQAPLNTS